MRENRFDQVKHGEDVGSKRPLELLTGYFLNVLFGMLFCGVVNEDVQPPEGLNRFLNNLFALSFVPDIGANPQTFGAAGLHQPLCFQGVLGFVQIHDRNRRSFRGECNSGGAADSTVSAGNQGYSTLKLTSAGRWS